MLLTGKPKALLALEDGTLWEGRSAGAEGTTFGELVFNTAMTGYQEILTDPSYKGQVVMMTYPEIGNYGINLDDIESKAVHVAGFVVRRLSPVTSSWRAAGSLQAYLSDQGIVCIEGLDTRALTRHIREKGAMRCGLTTDPEVMQTLVEQVKASPSLEEQPLVSMVTTKQPYKLAGALNDGESSFLVKRLVAVDFGMKQNIVRCLQSFVEELIVVPASTDFATIASYQPDRVFLSNGPGDPRALPDAIAMAEALVASGLTTFGICLGHQLLSLALGLRVEKMPFGHHGGNHPVHDLEENRIAITSQNHGYCVVLDQELLDAKDLLLTHINLNDHTVEGFRHKTKPIAAVQFHPEAAPGPHDAEYLFRRFLAHRGQVVTSS